MTQANKGIFQDEHTGMGGSYIVDKATGKRKLVQRTFDPREAAAKETPVQPAPDKTTV